MFLSNAPAPPEISTLSLHDALPISASTTTGSAGKTTSPRIAKRRSWRCRPTRSLPRPCSPRSEEHTSELQSHHDLVCRLLLEKKKRANRKYFFYQAASNNLIFSSRT